MNTSDFQSNIKLNTKSGAKKKIGIVRSIWNTEITNRLYNGCIETLLKYGVDSNNIKTLTVPGSFELIYGGKKIISKNKNNILWYSGRK